MGTGTAPALEPAEDLAPAPADPVGEPAQAEPMPEEPAPEEPQEEEPSAPEEETDPEEFEREFPDVEPEEVPPLIHRPVPAATTVAASRLPQTGADIVLIELAGGLLMGIGLALRLALRPA